MMLDGLDVAWDACIERGEVLGDEVAIWDAGEEAACETYGIGVSRWGRTTGAVPGHRPALPGRHPGRAQVTGPSPHGGRDGAPHAWSRTHWRNQGGHMTLVGAAYCGGAEHHMVWKATGFQVRHPLGTLRSGIAVFRIVHIRPVAWSHSRWPW